MHRLCAVSPSYVFIHTVFSLSDQDELLPSHIRVSGPVVAGMAGETASRILWG